MTVQAAGPLTFRWKFVIYSDIKAKRNHHFLLLLNPSTVRYFKKKNYIIPSTKGILNKFCLHLPWQSIFPHLSTGCNAKQELGEQSPTISKNQVLDFLRNLNIRMSIWWNSSQSPEGIHWCSFQAILYDTWKVIAARWSPRELEKGKYCTHL